MKRRYLWAIVIVVTLLSMLIAYPRESDADGHMCKLDTMKWEHQQNDYWCWVATVSMVLKSYGLDHAKQCDLYDLSKGNTTSCKDMEEHPIEWKLMEKNNQFGTPEDAAQAYKDNHPNTIEFNPPKKEPFKTFGELAKQVCPSDISQGRPFIWAYDKGLLAHDVIVYGYNDLGLGGDKYLYIYDPDSPPPEEVRIILKCDEVPDPDPACDCNELLNPACNGVLFESYRDGDPAEFIQDFFISKTHME